MLNKTFLVSIVSMLALSACQSAPPPEPERLPFSQTIYSATYKDSHLGAPAKLEVASNGKGRKLFDFHIDDYVTGKEYTLSPDKKEAGWKPLKDTGHWIFDEETFKALTPIAKSNGERIYNKRNCRGYIRDLQSMPPNVSEYWFDKNLHCLVYAVGPDESWSITMLSCEPRSLPDEKFEIPADYKTTRDPNSAPETYP